MIKKVCDFLFRDCIIHIVNIVTGILPNSYITTKIRGALIKHCIGKCGKNFRIASGVVINKPSKLEIGNNVYIAHNVWINAVGGLKIEDDSIIGPMSVIVTSRHIFEDNRATNKGKFAPIRIGRGCWLASHVVVTDGVNIDDGALIAAGAVVTHDVNKNEMVGGVPAKKIEKRDKR